jgi:hypothetical protein
MKQGDAVSLPQLALFLPETWNKFTVSYHAFGLVDAVSFFRRFQQVPQLVGQKRAIAVLGKAAIQDFLLVGSTLTGQKGHVRTIPVEPTEPLLDLGSGFSPTDRVKMPRHRFLVRPDSPTRNVDIQPKLDHPDVVQNPSTRLEAFF